jgi:hypothetical protein
MPANNNIPAASGLAIRIDNSPWDIINDWRKAS